MVQKVVACHKVSYDLGEEGGGGGEFTNMSDPIDHIHDASDRNFSSVAITVLHVTVLHG